MIPSHLRVFDLGRYELGLGVVSDGIPYLRAVHNDRTGHVTHVNQTRTAKSLRCWFCCLLLPCPGPRASYAPAGREGGLVFERVNGLDCRGIDRIDQDERQGSGQFT